MDVARRTVAFLSGGTDSPMVLPDQLQLTTVVDEQAGLAGALGLISAGRADALFVRRLRSLAGSLEELTRLLTGSRRSAPSWWQPTSDSTPPRPQGRRTVALLREIDRWSREPSGRSDGAVAPDWRRELRTSPSGSPSCASVA